MTTSKAKATGTLEDLGVASLAARRLLEETKQDGQQPTRAPTIEAIQEAMNRTIQETIAPLIGARFGVEAGTRLAETLFRSDPRDQGPASPSRPASEPKLDVTEIVRAGIEGRKSDQEFIDKMMAARFEAEMRAVEEARKSSERNDSYWQMLLQVMQQNHEKEMELVKAIYQAKEEARQQGDPIAAALTGTLVNVLSGLLQQRLTAESRDPLEEALARAEAWERLRSRFGGGAPPSESRELRLLQMQHELNMRRLELEMQKWREERELERQDREERARQWEKFAEMLAGAISAIPSLVSRPTPPAPAPTFGGPESPVGVTVPPSPAMPQPGSNVALEV